MIVSVIGFGCFLVFFGFWIRLVFGRFILILWDIRGVVMMKMISSISIMFMRGVMLMLVMGLLLLLLLKVIMGFV